MRWWFVVAVTCAIAGEADAKRVSCACPTRVTLPERGATNVPVNAKLWVLDGFDAGSMQVYGGEPLPPNAEHESPALDYAFTTGGHADTTPPRTPVVTPYVATNGWQLGSISMFGDYDPDTALVRIELHGRDGTVALVTTPRRAYFCSIGTPIPAGRIGVEIVAIDLAGNESPPLETVLEVMTSDDLDTCGGGGTAYVPRHRSHGFGILLGLFLYVMFIIGWGIVLIVRNAAAKRTISTMPQPMMNIT